MLQFKHKSLNPYKNKKPVLGDVQNRYTEI